MTTLSGNRVVPRSITNNASGIRTIALDLLLNKDCPIINNGTLIVTGLISGSKGIEISGIGTLDLTNNNTYSGSTIIESGTLKISGSIGAGNYAGNMYINGTLDYSSSSDQIISSIIDSYSYLPSLGLYNPNCKIVVNGPGRFHLRNPYGLNLFEGTVEINGGYLRVGNNDTVQRPNSGYGTGSMHRVANLIVNQNGTLELNRGIWSNPGQSLANINAVITGSGPINVMNGNYQFAGGGSYSGVLTMNSGTFLEQTRYMPNASYVNNGNLTLTVSGSWNPNYVWNVTVNGNTTNTIYNTDYTVGTSIGAANITAQIQSAGLGNNASEFVGFVPGRIALVQRGVQSFQTKVNNAIAAGASAVIIYNNTTGLVSPSVTTNIPVIMITQSLGQQLVTILSTETVTSRIDTSSSSTPFNNSITGNGTIIKAGDSPLIVSLGLGFTGIVSITGGVLRVSSSNGFGGASSVRPSTGAYEILGGLVISNPFSLGGTGVSSGGAIRNISDNNTLSGAVAMTAASRINSDAGTLTLSSAGTLTGTFGLTLGGAGNIIVQRPIATSTGALTKDGAGTVVLSAANTYTGVTTISGGTLRFAAVSSLYNGTTASWTKSNIIVNTGGTFALNVGGTNEFTTTNVDTLLTNLLTTINNNGLRSGSSIGFDTTNSPSDFTISSNITDSAGTGAGAVRVVKLGTGTLVLSGTSNTYSGGTTVSAGTMSIGSGGTTGSITGDIVNNATVQFNRSDAFTYAGSISGTGSVVKLAAGTTTLTGNNTYSGTTTISAGVLRVGHANALGSGTDTISLPTNTALELTNNIVFSRNVSSDPAPLMLSGGTLSNVSGNNTFAGNYTNTTSSRINSDAGTLTISNNINGAFVITFGGAGNIKVEGVITDSRTPMTLVKDGAGTLELFAANTYTGGTTINGGTLRAGNVTCFGTGTITVNAGATLDKGGFAITNTIVNNGGTVID